MEGKDNDKDKVGMEFSFLFRLLPFPFVTKATIIISNGFFSLSRRRSLASSPPEQKERVTNPMSDYGFYSVTEF